MQGTWRTWFRAIHRDVGYTAVALTLAYALSGLAVNHIEDWNPSYTFTERPVAIGALPTESPQAQQDFVVAKLAIEPRIVRGHFQESATSFRVFLDGGQEVRVDPATGVGLHKTITNRPVLYQVNALHLNNLKGLWTYVADVFAVALIVLALTGLTMMKGDRGLAGRGKWFVLGGLAIPVSAVVYMYS